MTTSTCNRINSKSLRRRNRRQTTIEILSIIWYLISRLIISLLIIVGIWFLISLVDISIHAPAMATQTPNYWSNNLLIMILDWLS